MESGKERCVVGSCCCGCSLRSGSLTIGILNLVSSSIILSLGFSGSSIIFFHHTVPGVIFSILLIYGIQKARRGLIMIWVWVNAVLLFISVILAIVLIVMTGNVAIAVTVLVSCALTVYFIIVIRSYALTL
ncbi:uncharacterized protein [Panulirus ornatus]|uniref:uncharacterized protein n=1 Tax=Panulirus ornatus TaxID=150431 RepID=UPI003A8BEC08